MHLIPNYAAVKAEHQRFAVQMRDLTKVLAVNLPIPVEHVDLLTDVA